MYQLFNIDFRILGVALFYLKDEASNPQRTAGANWYSETVTIHYISASQQQRNIVQQCTKVLEDWIRNGTGGGLNFAIIVIFSVLVNLFLFSVFYCAHT